MSKDTKFKKLIMPIIISIAAISGFIASNKYFNTESNIEFESLLIYPNQKTFSGFELINHNNQKLTINNFAGKWTLLFFGYTHCPDVCPTTLTELQKVTKQLKDKDVTQMPEVLFVSVDPERDTPELLNNYIEFFNPSFNAATADAANILAITSQVGVAYHIGDHKQGELNYPVDHTAAIFLIDPNKNLYGIFRSPHQATKIANDLNLLIGNKE